MSYVLIIAFIMRTGPDSSTTQANFAPARYYTTYDECLRDSKPRVDQELKAKLLPAADVTNVATRWACVPVTDSK